MKHNLAAQSPEERAKVTWIWPPQAWRTKSALTFPLSRPKLKGSSQRNCANTSGNGCSITVIWH